MQGVYFLRVYLCKDVPPSNWLRTRTSKHGLVLPQSFVCLLRDDARALASLDAT